MKKILIMLSLSACTTVQKTTVFPDDVIVSKALAYRSTSGWRETLFLYHQEGSGTNLKLVDSFPVEGEYPQIQNIERPKQDSLVVWLVLCTDLVVTRSYVLRTGTWTPL